MEIDIPFTVVMIKPLSVGRGHAIRIISSILQECPVTLSCLSSWSVCGNTLSALGAVTRNTEYPFDEDSELKNSSLRRDSVICVFVHKDRQSDPAEYIRKFVGPDDFKSWTKDHLRYQFSGYKNQGDSTHPSDTVVYIPAEYKSELVAKLLIKDFDPEKL